ncbi:MAG: hypothetical protein ACK42Z_06780 [Candidatus Kapaibacteriota bacterium]
MKIKIVCPKISTYKRLDNILTTKYNSIQSPKDKESQLCSDAASSTGRFIEL